MLDIAVNAIARAYNAHALSHAGTATAGQIIPGPLVDDDGKLAISLGSLGMLVVNLTEENVLRQAPAYRPSTGQISSTQPPLQLNMTLLIAARMDDYTSALKALSAVLRFFQANALLTAEHIPELGDDAALRMTLLSPTAEHLHHLWSYLGIPYQPSLLYQLGMLTVQQPTSLPESPAVARLKGLQR